MDQITDWLSWKDAVIFGGALLAIYCYDRIRRLEAVCDILARNMVENGTLKAEDALRVVKEMF